MHFLCSRPSIIDSQRITPELKSLIQNLMAKDPLARPSVNEVIGCCERIIQSDLPVEAKRQASLLSKYSLLSGSSLIQGYSLINKSTVQSGSPLSDSQIVRNIDSSLIASSPMSKTKLQEKKQKKVVQSFEWIGSLLAFIEVSCIQ